MEVKEEQPVVMQILEKQHQQKRGFALFRRDRLIKGVGENEGYRPLEIFKAPNSFIYQRVYGEIHLDDEEVTHTKDDFQWTPEDESEFLKKLKLELEKEPKPILSQADRFRKDRRSRDLRIQSEEGLAPLLKRFKVALLYLKIISRQNNLKFQKNFQKPKLRKEKEKLFVLKGMIG